jgi:hypothetical protein
MTQVADGSYPDPAQLPYGVALPKDAGAPLAVWVSNADAYPEGESEVVAEYGSASSYGAFRIRDEKVPVGLVDQSFIDQMPGNCTTCTDARLVDLGSSIKGALLAGAPGPTSITWLEGGHKLIVIGPADTFSADDAIRLSTEVAAGQDSLNATG